MSVGPPGSTIASTKGRRGKKIRTRGTMAPNRVNPMDHSHVFVERLDLHAVYKSLVATPSAIGRRSQHKHGPFAAAFTQPPQVRGILNSTNFCFMNAILQALIFIPPFAQLAISAAAENEFCPTLACLGTWLLSYWAGPAMRAISTPPLSLAMSAHAGSSSLPSFCLAKMNGLTQEDASEFMQSLLEVIQAELCDLEQHYRVISTSGMGDTSAAAAAATKSVETKGWTFVKGRERLTVREECNDRRSVLFDAVFGGTLENHVKGGKRSREHASVVLESFFVLQVDVGSGTECKLDVALERTLQKERVYDDVREKGLLKTVKLKQPPMVLLLQLRRWAVTAEREFVKLSDIVRFSNTLVLPKSVCSDATLSNVARSYELVAFVAHRGAATERGHYVAYLRNAFLNATTATAQHNDERLILCNDARLEVATMQAATESEAVYFVVYQRKS